MSNIIKLHSDRILTDAKVIKPRMVERPDCGQGTVDPLIEAKANELIITAEAKAKDILEKAAHEAEQLKNAIQEEKNLWEAEKRQLSEEAWNGGYQKGLKEGRTAGENEFKSLIETAIGTIDTAKADSKAYIVQAEQTILDLAMASTEAILGSTLSEEPEKFIDVVKKALTELKNEKEIEIFVHPSKFHLLVSSRNVLESIFPREVQCYIYPNEELNENDCVVECETIRIDTGIDSQLSELKERLAELLSAEQKP
ncbi:flagellar assembly protein FliH [Siminovitchia fortis]|uniref:flagellar assembly protein FliH n=1 Tax=Siminovitchia fortis TaxID=254758 RepID=UPI0013E3A450|nr:flagellar assembly protein FliH [Siminovitchia fortis]WHY83308.1 flagellar assembly protein FliH [Siminovitchia fortis]